MGSKARETATTGLKAQLSLEMLFVFLIFLTLLGIAYAAASRLGEAAQKKTEAALFSASFEELSQKISQACSLGNGNVRIAKMRSGAAAISYEGSSFSLQSGTNHASASSSCELDILQTEPAASFTIKNIGGKLEIS